MDLHVCLVVAEGGGGGGGGLMKWTDILRFEIFLAVGISVCSLTWIELASYCFDKSV